MRAAKALDPAPVSETRPSPTDAELCARYAAGDRAAGAALLVRHRGFIHQLAFRARRCRAADHDLLQEVKLGFLEQCLTFDSEKGGLLGHVKWGIQLGWTRFCDNSRLIRVPYSSRKNKTAHSRVCAEIARTLPVYLDDPVEPDVTLDETLADGVAGAEETLVRQAELVAVRAAVLKLTDREQTILRRCFSDEDQTMGQVAEPLGISRERVRQLKEQGLQKIRMAVLPSGA